MVEHLVESHDGHYKRALPISEKVDQAEPWSCAGPPASLQVGYLSVNNPILTLNWDKRSPGTPSNSDSSSRALVICVVRNAGLLTGGFLALLILKRNAGYKDRHWHIGRSIAGHVNSCYYHITDTYIAKRSHNNHVTSYALSSGYIALHKPKEGGGR